MHRIMRLRLLMVALISAVIVSACTSGAKVDSGTNANTPTNIAKFAMGIDVDPDTLDPTKVNRTQSRYVYAALYDPLIHRAPDGKLETRVLDKWEWVNPTTLRLTVHQGIKFHDGKPLTANDVAFTLERCLDPKSAQATSFPSVSKVNKVDESTVEIQLKSPDPLVLARLVDQVYVVPAEYYNAVGAAGFAAKPIGTGPFKFVSYVKDSSVVVEANKEYWKGPVKIDKLEFKVLKEDSTRVAALQSGEVDIVNYVPFNMAANLTGNVKALPGNSPDLIYVGIVPSSPVLKELKLRQAINHAVDRGGIAQAVQGDKAILGGTLLPGVPGYEPALAPYPFDTAKAKSLVADAGYKGAEIRLDVPIGRVARAQDLGQMIAAQLQQAGFKVRINEVEFALFSDMLYQRNGQKFQDLWIFHAKSSSMDPDDILGRSFHSKGGWNWSRVKNAALDDILENALVEPDQAKRAQMYRQADQIVKDEAYYVPLYLLKVWYGVKQDARWSWQVREDEMVFVWDDIKVK